PLVPEFSNAGPGRLRKNRRWRPRVGRGVRPSQDDSGVDSNPWLPEFRNKSVSQWIRHVLASPPARNAILPARVRWPRATSKTGPRRTREEGTQCRGALQSIDWFSEEPSL